MIATTTQTEREQDEGTLRELGFLPPTAGLTDRRVRQLLIAYTYLVDLWNSGQDDLADQLHAHWLEGRDGWAAAFRPWRRAS